jgi:hypothetical protein
LPQKGYINNQCWYVIENDQYKFRIEKWRDENIPKESKLKKKKKIKDVVIELRELES